MTEPYQKKTIATLNIAGLTVAAVHSQIDFIYEYGGS